MTHPQDQPLTLALIGGSGLGAAIADGDGEKLTVTTPFGDPSGPILRTEWAGLPTLILPRHGPGHRLGPAQVNSRANLFALKKLGATHVIASGAVGSLREHLQPRQLVVPDQLIDKTNNRPSTFFEQAAVHVEFADPFDPIMRQLLLDAGREQQVHDGGTYVCMEGPSFSTRAESEMHRQWGGDLIGMTALPEARLAREAELPYALVALVTDYDCWRPREEDAGPQELLAEIIGHLRAATDAGVKLMKRAVKLAATRRDELMNAPSRTALQQAIWTDRKAVPQDEVERLAPIWGRYFSAGGS
jgi:5'-methylthioadenosine phosphorylase